jgi:flagellar operon protein
MGYRIINGKPYVTGNFQDYRSGTSRPVYGEQVKSTSFKDILKEKLTKEVGFTISNHAAERMKSLNFNEDDMRNLDEGIKLAEEKGCKNSVLLYRDVAFVTSIENRTIITAVQKERAKENVFTNVDSVLFL